MFFSITPAEIGPDLRNALSSCGQQSTLEQIESKSQSAAAVVCKMRKEELSQHDILGVVALLGTVGSIELSRLSLVHSLSSSLVKDKSS